MDNELNRLRDTIDNIDNRIVMLLSERTKNILDIAHLKHYLGIPIHIPERESAIIERLNMINPGPLSNESIEHIFRYIIQEMRNIESSII